MLHFFSGRRLTMMSLVIGMIISSHLNAGPLSGEWRLKPVDYETDPFSRSLHAMVYDSQEERLVLFGAYPLVDPFTWTWRLGEDWQNFYSEGSNPNPRAANAMAYDQRRNQTVLFGGAVFLIGLPPITFSDTWTLEGSRWTYRNIPGPSPRFLHTMSYLPAGEHLSGGGVILFGGKNEVGAYFNDLWLWNGRSWREVVPNGEAPQPRFRHAMATDIEGRELVLFGGSTEIENGRYRYFGDTWVFRSSSTNGQYEWIRMETPIAPEPRSGASMTYDPIRKVTYLFGGGDDYVQYSDVWAWDGARWELVDIVGQGPRERQDSPIVFYKQTRGRRQIDGLTIFGGFFNALGDMGDMWWLKIISD